jgi:hypothetical protein
MDDQTGREFVRVLLRRNRTARVATTSPSGAPTVAPIWYWFGEDDLIASTMPESATVRNILRTGTATVLVDEGTGYADLRGAIVETSARAFRDDEAPPELMAAIASEDAKYADEIVELRAVRLPELAQGRTPRPTYRLEFRPRRARWYVLGGSLGGRCSFDTGS